VGTEAYSDTVIETAIKNAAVSGDSGRISTTSDGDERNTPRGVVNTRLISRSIERQSSTRKVSSLMQRDSLVTSDDQRHEDRRT
jgi:hypothetical protein